jgi:hypothetical protein
VLLGVLPLATIAVADGGTLPAGDPDDAGRVARRCQCSVRRLADDPETDRGRLDPRRADGDADPLDILFGLFQYQAALDVGAPTQIVVAAQAVGGAIGNRVAIHNVVAALTVVGLIGEEGRVVRLELIPVLYYGVATGVLTPVLAYVVVPGAF